MTTIDPDDVQAIIIGAWDANRKLDEILAIFKTRTMAKKKRLIWTAEDRARSAGIRRMLEERIAILDRKINARTQQSGD